MTTLPTHGAFTLRERPTLGQCPFCKRNVGVIGNWLAVLFGTGFHGCDFRNVMHPWEVRRRLAEIADDFNAR